MYKYLLLSIVVLMASCTNKNASEQTYWVNSLKVPCEGVGSMQCLQIQKGDTITHQDWELFYSSIEGFDFEPGYIYKLRVREEQIPEDEVPADGSSIHYTLVEELSKERDARLRINDIWALEQIKGEEINLPAENAPQKHPQIEFNLSKMRVMGTNGCNNFNGGIEHLGAKKLTLSAIAITKKACKNMEVPDKFNAALNEVTAYDIGDLKLTLYGEERNELLQFKKVD